MCKILCFGVVHTLLSLTSDVDDVPIAKAMLPMLIKNDNFAIDKDTLSRYKNGKRALPAEISNYIASLSPKDTRTELLTIARNIRKNIIHSNKRKSVVMVLKSIIINDSTLSPEDVIGFDEFYTKTNISNLSEFNFDEFLANVLHYVYRHRKVNEKGSDTIKNLHEDLASSETLASDVKLVDKAFSRDILLTPENFLRKSEEYFPKLLKTHNISYQENPIENGSLFQKDWFSDVDTEN